MPDGLHDIATVFRIANDAGKALRGLIGRDFQMRLEAIATPLNGLPQHRTLRVKMAHHVNLCTGDRHAHHMAVPADLRQESKS